ncbi:MAG: response regulator [Verrucomicrobiota bacterium]|nr:response regulator [Verrucomicrobiota bacterium]
MLDHENLKWIATTSTELNSMLQQISRYADLAKQHKTEDSYLEDLGERVELASKTAQALFDRVTSSILAASVARPVEREKPRFSVVPPPGAPVSRMITPAIRAARPSPLPVASEPSAPEFDVRNPGGTRELILLVDDEKEIAELAAAMLSDEGYRIILAKDGIDALKIYQHLGTTIGLVILDFFLPVLDGDAVFEELQALNPDVNVVLSSGFAEQTKLGAMLSRGLRGFIPKPYTRQKLLAQVRMTLEAAREAIA